MKKNPKCAIVATITVVTKQKGKKDRHGRFERQVEDILKAAYVDFIKHLVGKIPEAGNYTWKQVNKRTVELVEVGAI